MSVASHNESPQPNVSAVTFGANSRTFGDQNIKLSTFSFGKSNASASQLQLKDSTINKTSTFKDDIAREKNEQIESSQCCLLI